MNTYMEIIENGKRTYGYANLFFKKGQLLLTISRGIRFATRKIIDLRKIENLKIDSFLGGKRISFGYENANYIFFEDGMGLARFLQDSFSLQVSV